MLGQISSDLQRLMDAMTINDDISDREAGRNYLSSLPSTLRGSGLTAEVIAQFEALQHKNASKSLFEQLEQVKQWLSTVPIPSPVKQGLDHIKAASGRDSNINQSGTQIVNHGIIVFEVSQTSIDQSKRLILREEQRERLNTELERIDLGIQSIEEKHPLDAETLRLMLKQLTNAVKIGNSDASKINADGLLKAAKNVRQVTDDIYQTAITIVKILFPAFAIPDLLRAKKDRDTDDDDSHSQD